jgi:hypothetical protein
MDAGPKPRGTENNMATLLLAAIAAAVLAGVGLISERASR